MDKVPEKDKTRLKVEKETEQVQEDLNSDVERLPFIAENFEVLSLIGKGGMGSVYKVKDKNLDKIMAVKVLQKELTADAAARKRFEQETESASKLNHPNLVSVYGQGVTEAGEPYLVMDYLEGKSLAQVIKEEGALSADRAINIFIQICEALEHAHENSVIHRDIKPTNIILSQESPDKEVAKIVDFGIAKVMDNTARETHDLTQTGEVFGSPHYMSPEQCLGFMLKQESDIYSLGCSLYETLTGDPPFAGSNPIQLVVKHINDDVDGFDKEFKNSKKKKQLETVTLKCLSKEMDDRYPSTRALREDLEKIKAGKTIPAYSVRSKEKPAFTRRQMLIALPVLLGAAVYGMFAAMATLGDDIAGSFINFVGLAILLPGMSALMLVGYEKFKEIRLGKSSAANWWQMLLAFSTGIAGLAFVPLLTFYCLENFLPMGFMHPINSLGILVHALAVPVVVASFLGWLLFRKAESTRAWKVSLQLLVLTVCVVALPVLIIPHKISYIPENIAKATENTFPDISVLAREIQIRLTKHPEHALKKLGAYFLRRGEIEKALAVYDRISSIDDKSYNSQKAGYLFEIAIHYKGRNELDKAISYLNKALAMLNKSSHSENIRNNLLRTKVEILLEQKNFQKALTTINQALSNIGNWDKTDSELVLQKANILERLGRTQDAIKLLDEFIEKTGFNIDFQMMRALLLEKSGNYALALKDYQRLVDSYKAFGVAPNTITVHLKIFLYSAFKCGDAETFKDLADKLKNRGGSHRNDLESHLNLPISGTPLDPIPATLPNKT